MSLHEEELRAAVERQLALSEAQGVPRKATPEQVDRLAALLVAWERAEGETTHG